MDKHTQKERKEEKKKETNPNHEFILCWPTIPGYGTCPGVLTYPLEKMNFLFASKYRLHIDS